LSEGDTAVRSRNAGLLVYCIVNASSVPPSDARGVQGLECQRIVHGELAAVVSPLTEHAWVKAPEEAVLLDYERTIRSQHSVADVVPMRFGSVLPDEAAVRAHLDEQRAAYLRALARIAGCVEMGVRALVSPPFAAATPVEAAKPERRSGADYLKARQRRYSVESQLHEHCAAVEQAVLSKVSPLCREHHSELTPTRPGAATLCSLYFLVPREQVAAFRSALAPLPASDGAKLSLSGPWPPFNFVDEKPDHLSAL
jgi:hypothetical protein